MGNLLKLNDYLTYTGDINQHKLKETKKFTYWFRFKFLSFILSPILFFIEYFRFKKIWNLVKYELQYNEPIREWLDKQEFILAGNKFVKIDVINNDNILFYEKSNEVRNGKIENQFNKALLEIIQKNCQTDIENYINIQVSSKIEHSSIDELANTAELTVEEIEKMDLINPEIANIKDKEKLSNSRLLKNDTLKYVTYSVILRYNRSLIYHEKSLFFILFLITCLLIFCMIFFILF